MPTEVHVSVFKQPSMHPSPRHWGEESDLLMTRPFPLLSHLNNNCDRRNRLQSWAQLIYAASGIHQCHCHLLPSSDLPRAWPPCLALLLPGCVRLVKVQHCFCSCRLEHHLLRAFTFSSVPFPGLATPPSLKNQKIGWPLTLFLADLRIWKCITIKLHI